jgi:hypothetical protein
MATKTRHDWTKLDPLIDKLKAQGWNDTQIAKDLGIGRQTLVDHLRLHEASGTQQGTQKVPDEESIRYPEGTPQVLQDSGEPTGTHEVLEKSSEPIGTHRVPMLTSASESTLPEPIGTFQSVDEHLEPRQASTAHRKLLIAISQQVQSHHESLQVLMERVAMLEAENKEYRGYLRSLQPAPIDRYSRVKPSLPEWMRNLEGIPGYPKEPHKDSRLNIHLPEEERWFFNAIANGLDENISHLVRRILAEWSQGDEAQKGLRAHLERLGIHEGTVTGTGEGGDPIE